MTGHLREADRIARDLWATARREEQAVLRVASDVIAREARRIVRRLAAADRIRVRTARMGDTVVVVRLDARVWRESAADMREKLSPHD